MEIEEVLLAMITSSRNSRSASAENGAFDLDFFRDGFHQKVGRSDVGDVGDRKQSLERADALCFGDFALLHLAAQILADGVHAAVDEALFDIAQNHFVA